MTTVFATLIDKGKVVLRKWRSASEFNKSESWCNDKFIYIATSSDFKGGTFVSPMFDSRIEVDVSSSDQNASYTIFKSREQIVAHNLMFEARQKYLKIN